MSQRYLWLEEAAAVSERFFEDPILNSPYKHLGRRWELDKDGITTQQIVERRRES